MLEWFRRRAAAPPPPVARGADGSPPPFERLLAEVQPIPGMMSDLSVRLFDTFLDLQRRHGTAGPMLEIGVFKGKSAAVMAAHAAPGERIVLVDIEKQFDRETEARHLSRCEFLAMPSERFPREFKDYSALKRACRFIHIDASHEHDATLGEMRIVDELLADDGVAAFDDFANLDYAQNIAAIFRYLFSEPTDLRMFLVTAEKAYVCREAALARYGAFALEGLIGAMRERGHDGLLIARTDSHGDFRPVHLRPRLPGEEGDLFGPKIYRRFYKRF
jgi:hypothetical protein